MDNYLKKLKDKIDLSFDETKDIFSKIMSGEASEDEMHDFLTLLSSKGEASSEIAAGVYVLRKKSSRVNVENAIDTCGTGGDGKNTLNISTASALLLSSMGIKVAKHGNKAVSSKCGSGDVLEKLNININLDSKSVEKSINKLNFGFMFAPNIHNMLSDLTPIFLGWSDEKFKSFILAGDFNVDKRMDTTEGMYWRKGMRTSQIIFERIEDFLLEDCLIKKYPNFVRTFRNKSGRDRVPWQIDHMFASKDLYNKLQKIEVLENTETSALSDHYPIIAEFDIK